MKKSQAERMARRSQMRDRATQQFHDLQKSTGMMNKLYANVFGGRGQGRTTFMAAQVLAGPIIGRICGSHVAWRDKLAARKASKVARRSRRINRLFAQR